MKYKIICSCGWELTAYLDIVERQRREHFAEHCRVDAENESTKEYNFVLHVPELVANEESLAAGLLASYFGSKVTEPTINLLNKWRQNSGTKPS
jgi:hypothetical protein